MKNILLLILISFSCSAQKIDSVQIDVKVSYLAGNNDSMRLFIWTPCYCESVFRSRTLGEINWSQQQPADGSATIVLHQGEGKEVQIVRGDHIVYRIIKGRIFDKDFIR